MKCPLLGHSIINHIQFIANTERRIRKNIPKLSLLLPIAKAIRSCWPILRLSRLNPAGTASRVFYTIQQPKNKTYKRQSKQYSRLCNQTFKTWGSYICFWSLWRYYVTRGYHIAKGPTNVCVVYLEDIKRNARFRNL